MLTVNKSHSPEHSEGIREGNGGVFNCIVDKEGIHT